MRPYVKTTEDGKYEIWSTVVDSSPMVIVDTMEEVRDYIIARKSLEYNVQMILDIMTFPHGVEIDGEVRRDLEKMKQFNEWHATALYDNETPFATAAQIKLAELAGEVFGQEQLDDAIDKSIEIFKHNH